jgi:hypothetical protein
VYFQEAVAQISHININKRIFENISKDSWKGPFGPISPIDVFMAYGFFLHSLEYLFSKNSLVYIFMRCLSYRLIKIHGKITSAYLLCDKASLTHLLG